MPTPSSPTTSRHGCWRLGIKAEATGADSATLRIPFSEQLCRVGGIMCGQALLTGADTAMVIALAAASGGFKPCTTVDLTINYMRPITKADAVLEAKVMRLGKTLAFCTCEIREAGSSQAGRVLDRHLRHPGLSVASRARVAPECDALPQQMQLHRQQVTGP